MGKSQLVQDEHRPKRKMWLLLLGVIIIFIAIRIGYKNWVQQPPHNGPVVVLATVQKQDVPVTLLALGTVTPLSTVNVKTMVNGTLLRVLFQEGQAVKAGDLLAEIDPRPYEAQLDQYQGQLTRDNALLTNAEIDLQRYKKLWKQDSVAKQTYDTQASLVKQYEGAIALDQGLIEGVKVNLIYTRIMSPIAGRIGLRLVDAGNYVQTSDTTSLAVINTLNPITVIFSIPEDAIPAVIQQMKTGNTLVVKAYNREQSRLLAVGKLLTIDNQIDPTTGTVKLKAVFDNANSFLYPNQFVNIELIVKVLAQATVVPTAAIQYGIKSPFVFLFDNEHKSVSVKTIVVGVTINENTSIKSGVLPGQAVVVEGADKLTDGMAVTLAKNSKPVTTLRHSKA
jgi:multidrug efflux system membrane fusion protein